MFGHHHGPPATAPPPLAHEQTLYRIFCRADEEYCLTVRDNAVVLAPANPRDESQHWYKDMRHSTKVKDAEGQPAFALVNRATGLAIKHSLGQSHPVKLVPYNPEYLDESVLWTESHDVGKGFRCIRMVNNIHLNFDALHGDKDHGGVHDGTTVVLWEWAKGPNQSWKVLPWGDEAYAPRPPGPEPGYGGYRPPPGGPAAGGYAPPPPGPYPPPAQPEPGYGGYRPPPVHEPGYGGYPPAPGNPAPGYGPPAPGYGNLPRVLASEPTVRVFCKADDGYSLTVRNGTVCLAPTNPRDEFQHWVKDMRHSTRIKDEEGYPAFALVNKVTGEAIKHSLGQSHPVRLVPYNPDFLDESVLWTESRDVGHGFRCVRMVNNIYLADITKQVCMVQPKAEIDLQLEITKLSTPWGYLSAVALAVTTFGTIALMSGFFLKPGATFDDYVSDVLPLFGGFLTILGVSEIATRLTAAKYGVKLSPSFLVPSNWTGCLGVMNNYESLLPNKKALFDIPVARTASAYVTSVVLAVSAFIADGSFNGGENALFVRPEFFYNNPLLSFVQLVIGPYADELGNVLPNAVEGVGVPVDPLAFAGLLGIVVTSLNLLPIGRLEGGRIAQALFGRGTAALLSFGTSILLGVGAISGSVLCLAWGLFATFIRGGEEIPTQDEITPLGNDRFAWGFVLALVCLLTLVPNGGGTYSASFLGDPFFRGGI